MGDEVKHKITSSRYKKVWSVWKRYEKKEGINWKRMPIIKKAAERKFYLYWKTENSYVRAWIKK